MTESTKIPDNVWAFMDRACEYVGRIEEERARQEYHSRIVDQEISSPIEQLLYVAIHVMAKAHYVEMDPEPFLHHSGIECVGMGLHLSPQFAVDQYRVDFRLSCVGYGPNAEHRTVLIELDGHDFHDKDKRQRSYEKARDRHLARRGYTVLHFTGSDVVADPFKVAHEVMDFVEGLGAPPGHTPYDATNPLGIE